MQLEKQNIPTSARTKANQRFRDMQTTIDQSQRKLRALAEDRSALFGSRERYSDDPNDVQLEQRQQLLRGSDRLDRSTQRLKASQRLANETEAIGASTLADLHRQRETIQHTNDTLLDSEGYVDRSVKTLRGMARRYCGTPRTTPSAGPEPVTMLTVMSQDGYKSGDHDRHHHNPGSFDCRGDIQQVSVSERAGDNCLAGHKWLVQGVP